MADSVSRLKELLFQQESATLADLARRIEDVTAAEVAARAKLADAALLAESRIAAGIKELDQRLASLSARTGTPEALRSSVAEVIDDVIIEARETKQEDLSRALAPMMIKTIKAELKNNQAEMVEALYPITGQLVKAYVASAMKDLTNRMNRGIEANPFMLRVRSLFSGYSVAELALADSQQLEVEELYLIRRGSGELLQRWPAATTRSNSNVHMTSVLSAINDFSAQAFQTDGGHLRSFDVDDFTVFLRASPVYLLAAKCRGVAAPGVDSLFDAQFLEAVTRQHAFEDAGNATAGPPAQLLAELKSRLERGIAEKHEALSRAGLPFNPLRAIAATAMLALTAGLGWYGWTTWEVETTRAKAKQVIAATKAMDGYPVMLDVGARGRSISISGVAPSIGAKSQLLARLDAELPGIAVEEKGFAALSASGPDLRPQIAEVRRDLGGLQTAVKTDIGGVEYALKRDIGSVEAVMKRDIGSVEAALKGDLEALRPATERSAALRSLDRAQRRIEEALPDLHVLASRRSAAGVLTDTEKALGGIKAQVTQLKQREPAGDQLAAATAVLTQGTRQLLATAATVSWQSGSVRNVTGRPVGVVPGLTEAAEEIALAAERLAAVAAAAAQVPQQSARERLRMFAEANAVFFGNGDDYRDPARVQRVLAELAQLAKEARALVRVIGYTDERGAQTRNSPLAQSRADKVANALAALGVPRNRLVTVGRSSGPDISPSTGPDSANRRVEFELGFEGEAGTAQ